MASSEGDRGQGERGPSESKACRGRILRHLFGWSSHG